MDNLDLTLAQAKETNDKTRLIYARTRLTEYRPRAAGLKAFDMKIEEMTRDDLFGLVGLILSNDDVTFPPLPKRV